MNTILLSGSKWKQPLSWNCHDEKGKNAETPRKHVWTGNTVEKKSLVHEKQIEKDREKASIGETDSSASVQDRCAEAAAEGSV